jgi:hypothetical protein
LTFEKKKKEKKGHTVVVMEGSRGATTTSYPSSQELEKNSSPYVDCNFNWTNIDLSPDPGDQHQQQQHQHGSVYQEVVDISQSDIYQFAVSGMKINLKISSTVSTAEINI